MGLRWPRQRACGWSADVWSAFLAPTLLSRAAPASWPAAIRRGPGRHSPQREGLYGSVVALQPSVYYIQKCKAPVVRATPCASRTARLGAVSAVWLGGYAPQYWCSEARDRRGPLAEDSQSESSARKGARAPARQRGTEQLRTYSTFQQMLLFDNFFCSNHSAGEKSTQNVSPSLWVSFWRSLFSSKLWASKRKENPPSCACENPPNSPLTRRHFTAAFAGANSGRISARRSVSLPSRAPPFS